MSGDASTPVSAGTPSLGDVVELIEQFYPPDTAADWDAVGLVTGDLGQPVRRITFAVDPTLAVIEAARDDGTDLLITHHPLLLRGVHTVATTSAKGACVTELVVADIALYCAHTSADLAEPGVNDALAGALGLTEVRPLCADGLGRVGMLPDPLSLKEFAGHLAQLLPATAGGLRVSGDPSATVRSVAVLGGAGDDRFDEVRTSGADVYVTADLRHHPALEAREQARGGTPYLIDAGHWATESLWLQPAADRLRSGLAAQGYSVEVHVYTLRTDPWTFVVGAEETER